ncbi:23S rRNA (pseudouridine(1915)-N(3))-methyltransferase RlmH [Amphibiibacter pelophylacis]|uniref:23S rRNA (Pseudouridine(1915)-N(3))-methyltransferase RlmH n=1 Tax=Amphibiibacter pelophylacis TaxID=1799477 RepID=A0ACC6NZP1_9BURK
MKLGLIALAQRLPDWAQAACDDFAKRLPPHWQFAVHALKAESRDSRPPATVMQLEAARIEATLAKHYGRDVRRVVLDERGRDWGSVALAEHLGQWQQDGRDTVFVIGGADGIHPPLKAQADVLLRLSSLTLPHALARVVLIEQVYRAWSILSHHPYHRE